MHDGIFTVQWDNADAASGSLAVRDARGVWHNDTTWSQGKLRLDLPAVAGQAFEIQLPGVGSDKGILSIADVVQQQGSTLTVRDTAGGDNVSLDLSQGVSVQHGLVRYEFASAQVNQINIDGTSGSDQLSVVSSLKADKVELRPGLFALENNQLQVRAIGMETVSFDSGTGAEDRLAMYDSDGDDTLVARTRSAELTGLGYKFNVSNMDRYTINATGQGQDVATLYDSAGNDSLSVRPQFTSLWSDDYFVSVRGFERVFVYANQGGFDKADMYDSVGNDRFTASGEAATIVGPGFHSYTKFFEQINAHATAGGRDVAQLYGADRSTEWQRGSDFVALRESLLSRVAQGFEQTDAFVNGLAQSVPMMSALQYEPLTASLDTASIDPASLDPASIDTANFATSANTAAPIIGPASEPWPRDLVPAERQSQPSPSMHETHGSDNWDASWLLHEAVELQAAARLNAASESLHFSANQVAERAMLDEIFSQFSDS